ncbi:MAG: helix-turn-helix domain-containing protein [Candidatus Methanofastidiosum sp.]|nr:helix-turn-helix domain-containing protein [Methanofastidiosum sp.]
MSRKITYNVKKNVSVKELNYTIHMLEGQVRLLQRLYFIRFLYKGMGVEDASELIGITKNTGYHWLKKWNEKGQEQLIPNFKGGRRPKLNQFKREELRITLKELNLKKSRDVQKLIQEKYDVNYSLWQVRRILNSFEKNE